MNLTDRESPIALLLFTIVGDKKRKSAATHDHFYTSTSYTISYLSFPLTLFLRLTLNCSNLPPLLSCSLAPQYLCTLFASFLLSPRERTVRTTPVSPWAIVRYIAIHHRCRYLSSKRATITFLSLYAARSIRGRYCLFSLYVSYSPHYSFR